MIDLNRQIRKRRTFAIISHPDAGKTTLTEKLLLFSGAIHIAGSIKGRKSSRYAASDWMEIERQRGISVASSVMQMEYRDCVINLLDTPGHQDFSEDTYRVLTAVDAALMVIDAANGVEPQTLRLLKVCKARNTPVITFINKMDREVLHPLTLLDEIEDALEMEAVPFSWPIGMGKRFAGVFDLNHDCMLAFEPDQKTNLVERRVIPTLDSAKKNVEVDTSFNDPWEEIELIQGVGPEFSPAEFLAGLQTPVFFGSAINNFGVQEVLDALIELAPSPQPRESIQRIVAPEEKQFSAVVFKIQANMDPAHRDRIAFLRVCSGQFTRGMKLKVVRSGKVIRPNNVISFLSQRRDLLDMAFPGDIIGIPNHGVLQLGDTLTEGEELQFSGLPFFAPELFKTVQISDPMRSKQLRLGLEQLGQEGAVQVFKPHIGNDLLLGAIGALQFEVVEHRLHHEYGVEIRLVSSKFTAARWIKAADLHDLYEFIDSNSQRIAYDATGAPALLVSNAVELTLLMEKCPSINFYNYREHSGMVFQTH
jgi:peptide chain release factor 3